MREVCGEEEEALSAKLVYAETMLEEAALGFEHTFDAVTRLQHAALVYAHHKGNDDMKQAMLEFDKYIRDTFGSLRETKP